jgi:hypothetical protein
MNSCACCGLARRREFACNDREISAGFVEKLFPVAERFYALYREQFNPDLTVPESVVEEWVSAGTFGAKKKSPSSRNRSSSGRLPKEPAADH